MATNGFFSRIGTFLSMEQNGFPFIETLSKARFSNLRKKNTLYMLELQKEERA